jgi:hypothetical protein
VTHVRNGLTNEVHGRRSDVLAMELFGLAVGMLCCVGYARPIPTLLMRLPW